MEKCARAGKAEEPAPMEEPFFLYLLMVSKAKYLQKTGSMGYSRVMAPLAQSSWEIHTTTRSLERFQDLSSAREEPKVIESHGRLPAIRELCLAGEFRSAGEQIITSPEPVLVLGSA